MLVSRPAAKAVVALAALVLTLLTAVHSGAADVSSGAGRLVAPADLPITGPIVLPQVVPARVKVDMRNLPAVKPGPPVEGSRGQTGADAPPARAPIAPGSVTPQAPLHGATPTQFQNPERNFPGVAGTNRIPPDTVGDVGPNHYVQMTNVGFQIFDKDGNALLLDGSGNPQTTALSSLWTAAGVTAGNCDNRNDGDPIVLYDHLADRWVLTQFAVPSGATTAPGFHCTAVSQTADPTAGTWNLYEFQFANGVDYPKLGIWPDAYYMSTQRGFPSNNMTNSLDVYAYDRAQMIAGNAFTPIQFTIVGPSLIVLPSDLDGPAPPAGTPAFFARHVDGDQWGGVDRVDLFQFAVNWTTPALSTFTALPSIATQAFDSNLCNTGNLMDNCVPQSGTTQLLATLPHWAMYSLQFRTLGGNESMVFNHTVDVDGTGHAGVKWYQLTRPSGGAWAIAQEGVYSPDLGSAGLGDDLWRWMGSLAVDRDGNIALGYSTSDDAAFPSIAYTGRHAADAAGTMPHGEFVLQAGGGVQTPIMCTGGACGHRWGDYSAMRVDPVDDCTFWYTQEYIASTSTGNINWATQIGAFRFCNDPPVADADGPYATPEGSDVTLDGTGSSDPNPTDDLAFAWDLDNNATFETPGATPSFLRGDNGSFPVTLQVTDNPGATDTDASTVAVSNVAPSLSVSPSATAIDENQSVIVQASFTDPGWEDTYTASIDWGEGTVDTPTPTVIEGGPGTPDSGTFSGTHTYGDNGLYTVQVTVTDDDGDSDSESFVVNVANVDPTAVIDTTATGEPIIATAGQPVPFKGRSTDPGSDDLTLTWDFDDGPPSPDHSTKYRNNPAFDDPPNSPEVNPRDVTDERTHIFGDACVYQPTFTSLDDDGGSAQDSVSVVIQGTSDKVRSTGYWHHQYKGSGSIDFEQFVLLCYLEIAGFMSTVFNEARDASTIPKAEAILKGTGGSERDKLDRELLTAWLNFANGSVHLDTLVKLGGGSSATFQDIVAGAEAVRLNPGATEAQLKAQRQRLQKINPSTS